MKLPYRRLALVPSAKLTNYLLSETHPVGKSKARFFRGHGFGESNVQLLEAGLLQIAKTCEIAEIERTAHGTKYVILGSLSTPNGPVVEVRPVWFVEKGERKPRFVTAYPA